MNPIKLQALLMPSSIEGDYISITTYDHLCGQGPGLKGARDSAISVVSCYLDYYEQNNCELPLPKQQLKNAQELSDYFNANDPWRVKRKKEKEERKYIPGQKVISLEGIKDYLNQKKMFQYALRQNSIVGELARYFLNRSDKRLDLPDKTYIEKDETVIVPAENNLPELVFEFYRLEKMEPKLAPN